MKNKGKNTAHRVFLWSSIAVGVVILDQLTKYLAVHLLKPVETVPLIQDVLHLTYTTNRGAAFGMLADHRWIFLVISTVAIALIGYYLYEKQNDNPLLCSALAMILGGGVGNMIDRTLLGYVVDFVDFRLIHFAVFNIADTFVCIGCALVFLWIFIDAKNQKSTEQTDDTAST